jgi:FdhD protein
MMASPADLDDFAFGFSLTEGVIESATDIRSVTTEETEAGLRLVVTLASDKLQRHLARTRNLAGRTGCGLCGIDDLAHLPSSRRGARVPGHVRLSAVQRGLEALEAGQALNKRTRAVHAAGWCDHDGHLVAIREDVGRHNALDKLIGALMRDRVDPDSGFVVLTSRCSFEMVEKAASFGAGVVVAVSAPTTFAVERARACGLTMLAIARCDGAICFTDPSCVIDDLKTEGRRIA